mmetsp:Transcript_85855/g.199577  ORF Transcript_85855/g.199577 Transcript_85855/m.199577 type:complete len:132 (+) Transcript_85855:138-533(+)
MKESKVLVVAATLAVEGVISVVSGSNGGGAALVMTLSCTSLVTPAVLITLLVPVVLIVLLMPLMPAVAAAPALLAALPGVEEAPGSKVGLATRGAPVVPSLTANGPGAAGVVGTTRTASAGPQQRSIVPLR